MKTAGGRREVADEREVNRELERRCFTCGVRSYSSTVTTAAAPPRLLRHFVLLSHTHTRSHTPPHKCALCSRHLLIPTPPSLSLSTALSLRHLLSVIHPPLSPGFPSQRLSLSPSLEQSFFWRRRSRSQPTGLVSFPSPILPRTLVSVLSRACRASSTCSGCCFTLAHTHTHTHTGTDVHTVLTRHRTNGMNV